jgi:hypothetical protein
VAILDGGSRGLDSASSIGRLAPGGLRGENG